MVPALVGLALDYYRDPLARPQLSEVNRPLPKGFDAMLSEFCSALSAGRIDATAAGLATDRETLEEAARFFVRHVLLDAAGDYYRHLGLNRDASAEAIRHHYQLLIRMFHPDRVESSPGFGAEAGAFYATRINLAYQALGEPSERAAYDDTLPEYPSGSAETDPALFFRATGPAREAGPSRWSDRPNAPLRPWPRKTVPILRALLIGVLLIVTLYALIQVNRKPALRMSPDASAERTPPLPSFLAPSRPEPPVDVVGTGEGSADPLQSAQPAAVSAPEAGPGAGAVDLPRTSDRLERPPRTTELNVAMAPLTPEIVITPELSPAPAPAPVQPPDPIRRGTESAPSMAPKPAPATTAPRAETVPAKQAPAAERPTAPIQTPKPVVRPAPEPTVPTTPAPGPERPTAPTQMPKPVVRPTPEPTVPTTRVPGPERPTAPTQMPKPVVRPTPEPAVPTTRVPGPERPTAPIETPKPVAKPAPSASPPVSPPVSPPASQSEAPSPAQAANAIVDRLQRAYRSRNADAFAALFTNNARVNEGQGRVLIRSIYDELFKGISGANLTVSAVQWRTLPDGRIAGSGRFSVSKKDQGRTKWVDARGRMDLELISESGGYLISSMRYDFD